MDDNNSRKRPPYRFGMAPGRHALRRKLKCDKNTPSSDHSDFENVIGVNEVDNEAIAESTVFSKSGWNTQFVKSEILESSHGVKLNISKFAPECEIGDEFELIKLKLLGEHIKELTSHAAVCVEAQRVAALGKTPMNLLKVTKNQGLANFLSSICMGCHKTFQFCTSPMLSTPNGQHYEINVRGVWGTMSSGGGAAQLSEIMATMGVQPLSARAFTNIENGVGKWWEFLVNQQMLLAANEEKARAIDRNDFHEEVPAISVVADGGWSKRTHKHSYNALGGVAIVVGAETGKILHLGVRQKYCLTCVKADGTGEEPKPHDCFHDWEESSQSMEADIILDAFNQCEAKYGVRYMRLVGDGDSSSYAKLHKEGPPWCKFVSKIECANHACKNLRGYLERLVEEKRQYKGMNGLTKRRRVQLVCAVRSAIRIRGQSVAEIGHQKATKLLASDIRNMGKHVFGNHDDCLEGFCKIKDQETSPQEAPKISTCQQASSQAQDANDNASSATVSTMDTCQWPSEEHEDDDLAEVTAQHWLEGMSQAHQEDVRSIKSSSQVELNDSLMTDIYLHLDKMANKADRLLNNTTSNLAESWMAIRTKFDGGKRINRCQRKSWHIRCYGATLRRNLGCSWSPIALEMVANIPATVPMWKLYKDREKAIKSSIRSHHKEDVRARGRKRKQSRQKQATSKKARSSYGPDCIDVVEDVSAQDLQQVCNTFYAQEVKISKQEVVNLERSTKQQSNCLLWGAQRKLRITASMVGPIARRRPKISTVPLIRRMLYGTFGGNQYTRHGLKEEHNAILDYEAYMRTNKDNVKVKPSGLVVDVHHPWLGASPDGLVYQQEQCVGLVEVKNVLKNKNLTFHEAAKTKNFCLSVKDGELHLKMSHDYFYQCQAQMAVTGLPWVDIVIRSQHPHQLHVERITRDEPWWNGIAPKLEAFYRKALLPELASPREGKQPGIRDPELPWVSVTCRY
jgi:hypothetical protein